MKMEIEILTEKKREKVLKKEKVMKTELESF
jgi:hypothetical protein